jgi:hypothetical protein
LEGLAKEHVGVFFVSWSFFRPFGIFCGHLVYCMVNWYIFHRLVCCTKKNLATLALYQCKFVITKLNYVLKYFADSSVQNIARTRLLLLNLHM